MESKRSYFPTYHMPFTTFSFPILLSVICVPPWCNLPLVRDCSGRHSRPYGYGYCPADFACTHRFRRMSCARTARGWKWL